MKKGKTRAQVVVKSARSQVAGTRARWPALFAAAFVRLFFHVLVAGRFWSAEFIPYWAAIANRKRNKFRAPDKSKMRTPHSPLPNDKPSSSPTAWFAPTHWSVVLAAGRGDSSTSQAALEKLCRIYWPPLYAYVRRRKFSLEDAQDLTQEFFARFLAGNYLETVRRSRGKFRSYLLAALQHFLANEWDKARTAKRGGGQIALPLHDLGAENRYRLMADLDRTPEEIFDQSWALALLEQARGRLRDEYAAAGKERRFEQLVGFLPGAAMPLSYPEAARQLGLAEEAVRSEVCRLRKRYRELVRLEIAQTVTTPAEIEEKVRYLIAVLS